MSKRVTICDIAKELGVSATTITGTLNGKGRISEEMKKRVIETCMRMGYKPNKAAVSLARRTIKIGFIASNICHDFNNKVMKGVEKACEDLSDFNVVGDIQTVSRPTGKQKMISLIRKMADSEYDGLVISPEGDPRDYMSVLDELNNRKIPVALVVSDIPDSVRLFSVRTNARASGKMAEQLLYMMAGNSPVAIITGQKDKGVHKENVDGFIKQQEKYPLDLVAVYEHYEDPDIAYHIMDKILEDYPDIGGLYIGTSNSITTLKRIQELNLAGKIKIVASDVFPALIEYIESGVVSATIFQEPFNIGRLAFKNMYEHIAEGKDIDNEILLKPQIVMNCNLDLFI